MRQVGCGTYFSWQIRCVVARSSVGCARKRSNSKIQAERGKRMQRFTLWLLGVLFLMSPAVTFGQGDWTPPVVDITKADQAAVYKNVTDPSKNMDQAMIVADAGGFNIPIDEQHRVTPNPGPNGTMPFH